MKKIINIVITTAAIIIACIGGFYCTELVKWMGANMLTIKGVVGCYFFSFLIVGVGWFLAINRIN